MKVSILGCGWYGTAVGKALVAHGHHVNGSATTALKADYLKTLGIEGFAIQVSSDTKLNSASRFWNTDVLIIASNVKLAPESSYVQGMRQVAKIVQENCIQQVILISSTSVYPDKNGYVDEDSQKLAISASAGALIQLEDIILKAAVPKTTILRFGGLVGPGRMPGRFFAGKADIPNGRAPINLIHLEDCVGITLRLIDEESVPAYLNGVSPDHPSRSIFYTAAAAAQQLPTPTFVDELLDWKIVRSKYVQDFRYDYSVKDWMAWIQNASE